MNLSLNIIITSILQNVTKIFQNFFTYDPTQIYRKKKKKFLPNFDSITVIKIKTFPGREVKSRGPFPALRATKRPVSMHNRIYIS